MRACRFDSTTRRCPACGYVAPRLPLTRICRPPPPTHQAKRLPAGPGSHLKLLLSRWPFRLRVTPACPCMEHARQMDAWGCDECERRTDEILGWLRDEASKRGLLFLDAAGRVLIRRAIANARKEARGDARSPLPSQR